MMRLGGHEAEAVIFPLAEAPERASIVPPDLDRTIHDAWTTAREYTLLNRAFEHYNERLFRNDLPGCIITLSTRCRSAYGYFCAHQFESRRGDGVVDEIGLNPQTFKDSGDVDILDTLVHEMVHLWQSHRGCPGRRGYHNREWADQMQRVGLMPSTTGKPGGRRTGQRVSDYAIPGGPFDLVTRELIEAGFALNWQSRLGIRERRQQSPVSKLKYRCPSCRLNAWAKPRAELICGRCREDMVPGDIDVQPDR